MACNNNMKLYSKVAIVTGSTSSIGEATVRAFTAHGARAVVIADIQEEKGRAVAASVDQPGVCTYEHCNVANEDNVKAVVDHTVRTFGRLDIMFSNAGTPGAHGSTWAQAVLDLDLDAFDKVLSVNARGMAACVKHAARAMTADGGSIVCTASVAASIGLEMHTDYVMSKHAVLGLIRSSSIQLAGRGVCVNAVSPGAVGTPLTQAAFGLKEGPELDASSGCSHA